jgi:hypothetical protein
LKDAQVDVESSVDIAIRTSAGDFDAVETVRSLVIVPDRNAALDRADDIRGLVVATFSA